MALTVYAKRGNRNAIERKMETELIKYVSEKQKQDGLFGITPARNIDELKKYYEKYCNETPKQPTLQSMDENLNNGNNANTPNNPPADQTVNTSQGQESKTDSAIPPENADYNPLTTEPVAEKSYAKPFGATGTDAQNAAPIPEPTFTPPKVDLNSSSSQATPLKSTPLNPDVALMGDKERSDGAAQTAEMFFAGYEQLHTFGQMYVKVSDDELMAIYQKGDLSPTLTVQTGDGVISITQLFEAYNGQAKEALVVSKDWKDSIRPALIRLAVKYGWIMSDEWFVGLKIAQDLATKVAIMVGLKKTINAAIASFSEEYKKSQGRGTTTTATEAPKEQQKAKPSTSKEEITDAEVLEEGEG